MEVLRGRRWVLPVTFESREIPATRYLALLESAREFSLLRGRLED